ncbi:HipA domain-containing protein [Alteromonas sp. I4]|uniref:HipA domain-containing protein n=1 Tax=Alteromonadaceae TaxID=72275 RepID=UPI0012A229D0|nr:serine/threonine-protein kinase HipA [Alteromonas sp. I4]
MKRALDVYIDKTQVGKLTDENNIWAFEYTTGWLTSQHRHPLSPHITLEAGKQIDGSSFRPVQWFFDNLLPEEKARELLARHVKVPVEDAFQLLKEAGAESAGAITLMPEGEEVAPGTVHKLTYEEVNQRILNLPQVPLNRAERKRMSVAGAQHKMLVIYRHGELLEPSGFFPSTHILKPQHSSPEVYYHTVRNEWFVMTLAGLCGLEVPPVDIRYLPEPVYLIERFDRAGEYPHQHRRHVLDGCQLLNLGPHMKYPNSNAGSLNKLAELTRMKARTKIDIFRWALFNALVGNGDAHLKNLSFFINKEDVVMTPHYDLLSTAIYEAPHKHMDHQLSQQMGDAQYLGQLTVPNILAFAEELQLPTKLAKRELDRLIGKIEQEAIPLMQQVQDAPAHPGKGGEIRMIKEIYYNCIKEMVTRLTKA